MDDLIITYFRCLEITPPPKKKIFYQCLEMTTESRGFMCISAVEHIDMAMDLFLLWIMGSGCLDFGL